MDALSVAMECTVALVGQRGGYPRGMPLDHNCAGFNLSNINYELCYYTDDDTRMLTSTTATSGILMTFVEWSTLAINFVAALTTLHNIGNPDSIRRVKHPNHTL
jgi:hypothetical protein